MRFQTNGKIIDIYSSNIKNTIFLCGDFTQVGTNDGSLTNARNLAMLDSNFKYKGNDFFKMHNFISNNYDDAFKINRVIAFDNDTKIIVAGVFHRIGDINANNIAIFDLVEQKWDPLGNTINNGVDGQINIVKFFDNKIIVGGIITNANTKAGIINHSNSIDVNNIAIYNLITKTWHSLSDSDSLPGGGVNNCVYAIDIVKKTGMYDYDIYVGGQFSTVKTSNINLTNTYLLAKFSFKSNTNHSLNKWSSVLNLSNIFHNDRSGYEPRINIINFEKGLYGGKFNGYVNNVQVCNIFYYNNLQTRSIGTSLEFTNNGTLYSGEVKDIKFYKNNNAFIVGSFRYSNNYKNIAKYDISTFMLSSLNKNDNYDEIINAIAWVDNSIINDNIRIGRLFIGNNCSTDKKLIYNVPIENININENWSYSFYDNLALNVGQTITLNNYLNDSVFNKKSFEHSYYDSNIKNYLRTNFNLFQKNSQGNVTPVLIDAERLDSVLEFYDASFNEAINKKILFCLIKDNYNEIDLNGLHLPLSCYITCVNQENFKLKISNLSHTVKFIDNGGIDKKCVYESHQAGLGQTLIFSPAKGEKLIIKGVGSLLNDVFCFTKNTNVLTPRGYINIEKLKKGDYVINSNYKKVKIVDIVKNLYKPNKINLPYIIPKNSIDNNYPPENLELSSGHLIKYNDKWVHPKFSELFKQKKIVRNFHYYHIQLENYETDNLVVNGGAIIESYSTPSQKNLYLKRLYGNDYSEDNNDINNDENNI
jgi:hypothetical protein